MAARSRSNFPSTFSLLIDRLSEVSSLRDPASRRLCLELLTEHLGAELYVEDFTAVRLHLISIVQACRRHHPQALSAFITVVEQIEPDSLPVQQARTVVDCITAADLTAISTKKDLRSLLKRSYFGLTDEAISQLSDSGRRVTDSDLSGESVHFERRPQIWGGVPLRNVNFTGRTELLQQLREEVTNSTVTTLLPGALHGMGGVGKSQTAIEYVYRYADHYDIVWWIPAESTSEIKASLVDLARRLQLPVDLTVDAAIPEVLHTLHFGSPGVRWLLVFDNAEHPDVVCDFWPRGGPGHIIVTSRNPQWAEVARPIAVEVFERSESCQLLQRRDPGITLEDAGRLADALGDLPLAIEQAAAWRAETGMTTEDYLELLDTEHLRLFESRSSSNYSISVEAAWNVSLTRLRKEKPGAFELFKVCAFLSPEPISRRIFIGSTRVAASPEFQSILADPVELGHAIREIRRYSLAKVDPRNSSLQIHRLVQLVVRNKLTQEDREQILHTAHLLLANRDPHEANSVELWPIYAEIVPHILSTKASSCSDPSVRRLIINTIQYLFAFGDAATSLDLARESNIAWRDSIGEKHEDTLVAAQWWARLLRFVGRFEEGRALAARTLEMMRQELGDTHEETLTAMNSVASDLRVKGEFDAARRTNEFAYKTAVEKLGPNAEHTLAVANNYALSLRLSGKYWAARELDAETIMRKNHVIGENHRNTLLTRDNWAVDVRETGDYALAREEHRDVVRRMRDLLGERHPMTLWALKNLAASWRLADHHDDIALRLAVEAVEKLVDRHGETHTDSMAAILELSVSHRYSGNVIEARDLGKHIWNLYEQSYGTRHPFSLAASMSYAVTLRLLGSVDEARSLNSSAYNDLQETLGADHPFTLACAVNLSNDLAASNDHHAALTLDQETYARSTRILGAHHPRTLALAFNLALDLRTLNPTGPSSQRKAIHRLRKIIGTRTPETVTARVGDRASCDIDIMQT